MFRSIRYFRDACVVAAALLLMSNAGLAAAAQSRGAAKDQPADAKALKSFATAEEWQNHGDARAAIDSYRKANKQDGGGCMVCLNRAYDLARNR